MGFVLHQWYVVEEMGMNRNRVLVVSVVVVEAVLMEYTVVVMVLIAAASRMLMRTSALVGKRIAPMDTKKGVELYHIIQVRK
jgi:hypothetical protein